MKGLKEFFSRHRPEIVIFAGKGGLGKTTCSAALAYHMATQEGKRTLCFSTDPQASLSDIFERNIYGQGVIELLPNLNVVEIDADRRVSDYQQSIKRKILDMYGLDELPAEIEEYIDSTSAEPAMYESATYDAMAELVAAKEYDLYIFDMPPFGHGVRMVAMAEILGKWVEKITEARTQVQEYEAVAATLKGEKATEDLVMKELVDIRNKIKTFTDLLTDSKRTAFFMVIIPEQMAILDTERALGMFDALGMRMSGLILNQVYPKELLEKPNLSEFLKNRIEMQQHYLGIIREKFGDLVVAALPMYTREPKGLQMLAQVAEDLMYPKLAL
ncbi:MAG: TRC40/GET3/ArsA family transport-energizing ATPase [Armatimonadota bacterium]|nr:TRC40/GET3/ArsA family transport-energizing ATPase [Armatimonadota bacterium]MDR5703286.1 TRC40/GET3/ArsA family transport-energizing ATPase [Armatimonadota bacterium]MDR7435288.1 TRC40/GET3/ArsA family transport-energizing ATPase [Armatimonadota bacterium]